MLECKTLSVALPTLSTPRLACPSLTTLVPSPILLRLKMVLKPAESPQSHS